MDAMAQELAQRSNDARPHAGIPESEAVRAQQQDAARFGGVERLADAARVTPHNVQLELPRLLGLDSFACEAADACGHSVHHSLLSDHSLDRRARPRHEAMGAPPEHHGPITKDHIIKIVAAEHLPVQDERLRGLA